MSSEKAKEISTMFSNQAFRINFVPRDSRQTVSRWSSMRSESVFSNLTLEEIELIIQNGVPEHLRELSRFYYRTNAEYRNNVDFLANLPLYETVVTPIFEGKGSKAQIIKAFYNACYFIEKLDVKNMLCRITKEWIKSGIYYGILQENGSKVVLLDLPIQYCRTRYKDYNNLNILEFNIMYFMDTFSDEELREAAILNYPDVIQVAWRQWKEKKLSNPWVQVPAINGGVCFCFEEDRSPLLIAAIPSLFKEKDAVGREEKHDENELYKLLIQRMPIDSDGHLVFELDEVEKIHMGVAQMLSDLDTVDVLTTFGETSLENLQDTSAASASANRIEKYKQNAFDALGRSSLLFNPDNSSSLSYSIKKDETLMKGYLNHYSTWIKFLINTRFSRNGLTFDFEVLPLTMFNKSDYQKWYFQAAQYGYSKMYAGVVSGVKQLTQISLMDFENDFLHMSEKMIPLQSSYTNGAGEEKNNSSKKNSSGSSAPKDITNEGGRPPLPDGEKSEQTQANIDSMG